MAHYDCLFFELVRNSLFWFTYELATYVMSYYVAELYCTRHIHVVIHCQLLLL